MSQFTTHAPTHPGPRPEEPYPVDPLTATRHLCAGAYLDETFRNECLREVYYEPKRIVAPSFGFDAVPVLAHCVKARNGALIRDAVIVGTVLVTLCAAPASLFLVLTAMAALHSTIVTYRLAKECFQRLRANEPMALGPLIIRLFFLLIGYCVVFLLFWLAVALAGTAATTTSASSIEGFIAALGAGAFLVGVLIFGGSLGFHLWRQSVLDRMMPGVALTQPVHNQRLEEVARQQRGNTTVYSGFRSYVGSGDVAGSSGFAIRLVRAVNPAARQLDGVIGRHADGSGDSEQRREFEQLPFAAQQLVDHVRERLSTLLPQRAAEEQIAGLTVEDRVCLAGTEVSQLLPYTPPDVMAAVIRHPTSPARHYLACQVFAWGGQLIPTVYVHVAVQGRSLYLEMTTTVLPPCDERFRIVDSVDGHGAAAWWRAVKTGVADAPRAIWRAPVHLASTLINMVAGQSSGQAAVTRGFDYGARVGIRELGSDTDVRYLAQSQDIAKYHKLIERRVFASVLDYLDSHDIDTSEFRSRAASVLNISGGVFASADSVTFAGPVAGRDMNGAGEQ
ncbi:hypothetical protein Aph02nite_11760 [Actinoplanes philippinensis]|uniref:Uncharacterized protein n=1 Tax=Actinoplanes philippinensis TaxID=35752 RepID=A0A1I2A108_9ACTN|nr:hypothetical protein [Actinoplanes philippinensis]GIE75226.1 hypothetical protein Aph02nite_11760 [Actinoplanes philippinensis]SFE36420.1 hypothetical protein SAMN05421541_101361 [Actinoplanes philippinensis]